jgi:hypothetical protein
MRAFLVAAVILATNSLPGLAMGGDWKPYIGKHDNIRGAPGPIAGAGLPILAIGYGVYWLVKRRRKAE